eukprot:9389344-Prorocentrum_lima.AAC.1
MVGEAAIGVVALVSIYSRSSPQSARNVKVRPMRRPAPPHRTTRREQHASPSSRPERGAAASGMAKKQKLSLIHI